MKNKVGKLSFHLLTTTSCRSYRGLSCWQLYYSGHYVSSSNTITSVRQIGSLGIRTSGDIEPYQKIMTRRTTRNSASWLSSAAEVADEKPAVSTKAAAKTKKKTVAKKKSSKATKASPKREPKVVISSQEEGDEIDSPPTNDGPWFHIFTKGDEEYDRYMATEWGFEKVIRSISSSDYGSKFHRLPSKFHRVVVVVVVFCFPISEGNGATV